MKNNLDDKKNVEEVFCDDFLSEKIINGESLGGELSDEDIRFSKGLLDAVSSKNVVFNASDRDFLAARIAESIEKSKKRNSFRWIGYAASLLILIALGVSYVVYRQGDIIEFASAIKVNEGLSSTQLLLPREEAVTIDSPESTIAYSKNGNTVVIDSNREISQNVDNGVVQYNTVVVPYGKRSQVILSDNTIVWLNSGSRLVYPARFSEEKREVYLEGEALFEVTHNENHPFHVLTKDIEVKVLGTVFDLSAYEEDSMVNTVLERGSVEVVYNKSLFGSSTSKMVPGKLASYSLTDKSISMQDVDTKDFTSWKDGYLAFKQKSLESIIRRLSRYYDVSIEFENPELAQETFSGYLDLRNSAMQVLSMISETMEIEIIQTDKGIKIKRKTAAV
jgi:Fe2+-dicitrate sensor, membrane component